MENERLTELRGRLLDATNKSLAIPPGERMPVDDFVSKRLNALSGDLDFPVIIAKEDAISNNLAVMAAYCRNHNVDLAPHGKTTMAPQLFARQFEAGSWAITAATVAHCRTYREFGVPRILLANVLVDPSGIRWIAEQLDTDPEFDFLCYADSVAGVQIMTDALAMRGDGRPISVLVELGYTGGRTGCRTVQEGLEIARQIVSSPGLRLAGVAGFEGLIPGVDFADQRRKSEAYLADIHELAAAIIAADLVPADEEFVVSAGGSSLFDQVVAILGPDQFARDVRTVLRSGCYVTHDHEMYALTSPLAAGHDDPAGTLEPAFELWATVWSRPEPGIAILGFGKRDAPYDYRLPIPVRVRPREGGPTRDLGQGYAIRGLNDQHAFLSLPADDPLSVGDHVMVGISHPCGVFDKWKFIPVVDDDYTVVDGIWTFF